LIDFSEFTGLGNGSPLPVELLNFTATAEDEIVHLNWTTASEINNAWFEVERSADAVDFESILQQVGAGNSSLIRNYQDLDKQPLLGVSYYRLKQVDFNGDYSYSDIIPVHFDLGKLDVLSAAGGQDNSLTINFNKEVKQPQFSLFDLSGRLLVNHQSGSNGSQFTVPVENLPLGIYLLKCSIGGEHILRKVKY
jgi:hypothetical protein